MTNYYANKILIFNQIAQQVLIKVTRFYEQAGWTEGTCIYSNGGVGWMMFEGFGIAIGEVKPTWD